MPNRSNSWAATLALFCVMLLVAACGNANSNADSSPSGSPAPNGTPASSASPSAVGTGEGAASSETAAFPRTISAANGDITIEEQPQRVAVVHWGYGDSLLLFNLESVGLALPFSEKTSVIHTDSYKPYVDKVKELEIVGENTKVNLEALLAYGPDVIIGGNAINQDIVAELEKIAPTVILDEQTTDVWGDWPSVVTKFGEILGQEDVAESYISDYKAKLQSAKEKLAGLEGTVAFVQVREKQVYLQGTNYLKPYYEGLGLTPPESADIAEGAELSLEGLAVLDPDHLFLGFFNYGDKSVPALTDQWEDSEVWSRLKAVENNHVYAINGELALGYGPIGNSYGVDEVLKALEPK